MLAPPAVKFDPEPLMAMSALLWLRGHSNFAWHLIESEEGSNETRGGPYDVCRESSELRGKTVERLNGSAVLRDVSTKPALAHMNRLMIHVKYRAFQT
jgi:hypothetical protein